MLRYRVLDAKPGSGKALIRSSDNLAQFSFDSRNSAYIKVFSYISDVDLRYNAIR